MDAISLTSLVVAVSVALGVLLKECGFCHFKRFKSHCGCCDVNIDAKTPTSNSPSGASTVHQPSVDKLQTYLDDKKHQADELINIFKRRMSEGDLKIPPIELPQINRI